MVAARWVVGLRRSSEPVLTSALAATLSRQQQHLQQQQGDLLL